jgi:hypothetical protein
MMDAFVRDLRQPEYLHVLLNPIPVYGLAIALLGLLISIVMRTRTAQVAALALVLVSAGMAWPVFELGEKSSDRVLSMSDDDGQAWLKVHQHRAEQLIPFFYGLAAIAVLAIAVPIKYARSSSVFAIITLVFGMAVLGMGGYIAYAGGKIRHREFRTVPPPKVQDEDSNPSP